MSELTKTVKRVDRGAQIKRDGSGRNLQIWCTQGLADAVVHALKTAGYPVTVARRMVLVGADAR